MLVDLKACFLAMHYLRHILKGKPGEDVGQPGILPLDTRVSHISLQACVGHPDITSSYNTGWPTSSTGFP